MRQLLSLLVAAAVLAAAMPALADESLSERLLHKAEPLVLALSLVGTPYRFGGKDPKRGLDCSGFVRYVYKHGADIDLPHNAQAISEDGVPVTKDELQPGDLVFFKTLRQSFSHVGIYAGDGKFVHASSRTAKEVVVSDITAQYWAERFDGARRLLPPE
jgi:cell wall-associated NlpC family hydrolase